MEIMGPTHLLYGKEERRNAYQKTTLQVVQPTHALLSFLLLLLLCSAALPFFFYCHPFHYKCRIFVPFRPNN